MKKVSIKDFGDPLVDLKTYCPKIVVDLEPARSDEKSIYLRKTVASMLNHALTYLPQGVTFVVSDGWRSIETQEKYHKYYLNKVKRENPNWLPNKIFDEAYKLAPLPNLDKPGHISGGAVDLQLCKNSRRMSMNNKKILFIDNALSAQKNLPKYIYKNRKILTDAMTQSGFTNYPNEYWHWSYGEYFWAILTSHKSTIYGPVDINGKSLLK